MDSRISDLSREFSMLVGSAAAASSPGDIERLVRLRARLRECGTDGAVLASDASQVIAGHEHRRAVNGGYSEFKSPLF